MGRHLYIFSSKVIPKGFLIFLMLVFVFETFVYFIPEYAMFNAPYEHVQMRMKGECVDKENKYDVIILGDCKGWAGIRTTTLEEALSVTGYNLSVNVRQSYLIAYIMLTRYLRKCVEKPTLVILQVSANSLLREQNMDFIRFKEYILPYFRVDADLMNELPTRLKFECYTYSLLTRLPSLKRQYFLRNKLWPVKIFNSDRALYQKYLAFFEKEKGYYSEDLDPSTQRVEVIKDIPERYKKFLLSEYNLFYIKKILLLLKTHHINVVICTSPVRNDELRIWDRYNVRENLNSVLVRLSRDYNARAFWDMSHIASNEEYFVDDMHLNDKGAAIYTKELALKIKNADIFQ